MLHLVSNPTPRRYVAVRLAQEIVLSIDVSRPGDVSDEQIETAANDVLQILATECPNVTVPTRGEVIAVLRSHYRPVAVAGGAR